jgi:serine O-acetyltransferase
MRIIEDMRSKRRLYQQHGERIASLRVVLADGTIANLLYRLQQACVEWRLSPLALLFHLLNKWMNGCVIGVKARLGEGLVLIHPVGVVINSSVVAGRNLWIESGVVIGENRGRFPVIGNNVFVGSGAKIIGGVTLGDDCRVGANAVVMKDVPAGATAVGVPARIIAGSS